MMYKVREELIQSYVNREVKKKIKTLSISYIIALSLMFWFTYSYGVHGIIIPPLAILLFIIFGIIALSSLSQVKNLIQLTYFYIKEDEISKILDKYSLNAMNKIGVSMNESKHGVQFNQSILITEIKSTKITEDEIIIKSRDFDIFTGNGKIILPKELADFETIKSEIISKSNQFKILD